MKKLIGVTLLFVFAFLFVAQGSVLTKEKAESMVAVKIEETYSQKDSCSSNGKTVDSKAYAQKRIGGPEKKSVKMPVDETINAHGSVIELNNHENFKISDVTGDYYDGLIEFQKISMNDIASSFSRPLELKVDFGN